MGRPAPLGRRLSPTGSHRSSMAPAEDLRPATVSSPSFTGKTIVLDLLIRHWPGPSTPPTALHGRLPPRHRADLPRPSVPTRLDRPSANGRQVPSSVSVSQPDGEAPGVLVCPRSSPAPSSARMGGRPCGTGCGAAHMGPAPGAMADVSMLPAVPSTPSTSNRCAHSSRGRSPLSSVGAMPWSSASLAHRLGSSLGRPSAKRR